MRKLAAVDMAWLGTRIVVAEYALGVVLPLALGLMSLVMGLSHQPDLANWQVVFGMWLVTIAANYCSAVPLCSGNRTTKGTCVCDARQFEGR
jgi:membrane protein implicated in regulation of membrane protease activity